MHPARRCASFLVPLVFFSVAAHADWRWVARGVGDCSGRDVGESRGSWDRPSRSAILGLLGAALGITREDQAGHDALDAGYGIAIRLDSAGTTLSDYHTAQTVAASAMRKARPRTRAQLLAGQAAARHRAVWHGWQRWRDASAPMHR